MCPGHWLWQIREINTVCDMYIFADLVCDSWIRCRTSFGFSEGRFSLGRILTADTIISMIVFFLLKWSQRFVFHFKFHCLVYISTFAEPENQIITFIKTFGSHTGFSV